MHVSLLTYRVVKQFTKIPVPDVLAWSAQNDNPIGNEYIIMSKIPGVLLKDVWNTMTASQHIKCIESIAYLVKKLSAVDVPCYGSLYNSTDGPDGLLDFETHYGIGPLCKTHLHENEVAQTDGLGGKNESLGPCAFSLPRASSQC